MKKNYYVIMLVSTILLSSCGASKKLVSSPPQSPPPQYIQQQPQQIQQQPQQIQQPQQQPKITRVKEEIDECEKLSYEITDGMLRAYASAVDADKDFARQIAVLNARGQLVSDIQALVTNVMKSYRASTRENTNTHSEGTSQQEITQIAEEIVSNTSIICSNRYALSNGTYESAVCIGMVKNIQDVIKDITLSQESRLNVKFNQDQFGKSYKEELENYRQQKLNGGK